MVWKTSSLWSGSASNNYFIKSLADILKFLGKIIEPDLHLSKIILGLSDSFYEWKGVNPPNISHINMPKDHKSAFESYPIFNITSGAR